MRLWWYCFGFQRVLFKNFMVFFLNAFPSDKVHLHITDEKVCCRTPESLKITHFMPQISLYTPENIRKPEVKTQRFSYIFKGYRKRPVAWNGLNKSKLKRSVVIRLDKNLNQLCRRNLRLINTNLTTCRLISVQHLI